MKVAPPMENAGSELPVVTFVRLEHYNGIRLVQSIHASLAALSKVIRGTILLNKETRTLATSLLQHETPTQWQKKWEGPDDPLQYLRSVMSRALAIQKWLQKTESESLLQDTLDLSELFHPDTFLNALRQQSARKLNLKYQKHFYDKHYGKLNLKYQKHFYDKRYGKLNLKYQKHFYDKHYGKLNLKYQKHFYNPEVSKTLGIQASRQKET
ncbi:cytoplasmic dynein 2 heavy chain 1-like [Limulus polyphemus]|uniref:Cytoplasmic dynein 2 heavy chain 1-like n=1 Tax=Limulus polyphemus TaxID=6850 RepID=A0ABM1RUA2_LIMPO|nr:cytoplasmic dynein 2 heavy chain 1-like [Limulus polyphemus]